MYQNLSVTQTMIGPQSPFNSEPSVRFQLLVFRECFIFEESIETAEDGWRNWGRSHSPTLAFFLCANLQDLVAFGSEWPAFFRTLPSTETQLPSTHDIPSLIEILQISNYFGACGCSGVPCCCQQTGQWLSTTNKSLRPLLCLEFVARKTARSLLPKAFLFLPYRRPTVCVHVR